MRVCIQVVFSVPCCCHYSQGLSTNLLFIPPVSPPFSLSRPPASPRRRCPPSRLPLVLHAGPCSRQVSWHAAPHPPPFVSTSGRPRCTSAVSVNIYWPSSSSPLPLMSAFFCQLCTHVHVLLIELRRDMYTTSPAALRPVLSQFSISHTRRPPFPSISLILALPREETEEEVIAPSVP